MTDLEKMELSIVLMRMKDKTGAMPRWCVTCGKSFNRPNIYTGLYSRIVEDDGEHHYECWAGRALPAVLRERERCAKIAEAIDSGRGNEKEIAAAIRNPQQR